MDYMVTLNAGAVKRGSIINETHPSFETLRRTGTLVPIVVRDDVKPADIPAPEEVAANIDGPSEEETVEEEAPVEESKPRGRGRRSSSDAEDSSDDD
jgi:hypothetical protein